MATVKHKQRKYDAGYVIGQHQPVRAILYATLVLAVTLIVVPFAVAAGFDISVWPLYAMLAINGVISAVFTLYTKYRAMSILNDDPDTGDALRAQLAEYYGR